MADDSSGDKTEQATPKRLQEAREKGTVAKSTELNSAVVLLFGLTFLYATASKMWYELMKGMRVSFLHINTAEISMEAIRPYFFTGSLFLAKIIGPFLGFVAILGLTSNILQIGFLLTTKPLEPNLSKLNPLSGIKNLVSVKGIAEAFKSIFKIVLVTIASYLIIKSDIDKIFTCADYSSGAIIVFLGKEMFKLGIIISAILFIMAIIDYAFQRWNHMRSMRMTKQEIKEERKNIDGNPLIKSRIKSLQREMARRRMMDEVPKSTVVITNPTYIAIALLYEEDMSAPKVVAKGKRAIAERIKETAKKNDVPIVEDKPLARSLYDIVEPGDEIPSEYFAAVAEILAYIYNLKNRKVA